jgi:hypothetical protein
MGNSCESSYFPVAAGNVPETVNGIVNQNSYKSCDSSPPILTTILEITSANCPTQPGIRACDYIYNIKIGTDVKFRVIYLNKGPNYIVDKNNISGNVAPIFPSIYQKDNPLSFDIILLTNTTTDAHKDGDIYSFLGNSSFGYVPNYMAFHRDPTINVNTNAKLTSESIINNSFNSKIQIPSILIQSQTLIDAADIGYTTFEVIDDVQYYCNRPFVIPNNKCPIEYIDIKDAKITNFEKHCPKGVKVLRGKGLTAYEKVMYLFETSNLNIYIEEFASNLLKYAMVKYLLGRILYGKFNLKYILQKYDNKILRDLANTRFCHFVEFFNDPNSEVYGYNQYFL